jgi:hypothetical protein
VGWHATRRQRARPLPAPLRLTPHPLPSLPSLPPPPRPSELCEYANVLCWDGAGPVAVVPEPIRQPSEAGARQGDSQQDCWDHRTREPSALEFSGCYADYAAQRSYTPQDASGDAAVDHSLPLAQRRWGPLNRGNSMVFREVAPFEVFGAAGSAPLGAERLQALVPGAPASPGLRVRVRAEPSASEAAAAAARAQAENATEAEGGYPQGYFAASHMPPAPSDVTVDWLDGALWLVDMPSWDLGNPLHTLERLGGLWDAQRSNGSRSIFSRGSGAGSDEEGSSGSGEGAFGSHPLDRVLLWARHVGQPEEAKGREGAEGSGAVHPSRCAERGGPLPCPPLAPRSRWRIGSAGALPPQDYVMLASAASQYEAALPFDRQAWFGAMLRLMAAPGARVLPPATARAYSPTHLLCARRAAIVGAKPRVFTGRSDAYLLRNRAYVAAGVSTPAYEVRSTWGIAATPMAEYVRGHAVLPSFPAFPPRTVTILDRPHDTDRYIANVEAVVAACQAVLGAGGPQPRVVTFNPDDTSFEEQVAVMAGTGILVALHGAALANIIFLPAGAAVIELFPWRFHKVTYRSLAGGLGLHYQALRAQHPPAADDLEANVFAGNLIYHPRFYRQCLATGASSHQFHQMALCLTAVKHQTVAVDTAALRPLLLEAMDHIGGYSDKNPYFAPHFQRAASDRPPLPSLEEWLQDRPAEAREAFVRSGYADSFGE